MQKNRPLPYKGIKFDSEKLQWHLLPLEVLRDVIKVLMYGAKQYAPDNWKYVKPKERYYDACMRHLDARQAGEQLDPESRLPHIAHAICCLIFYLWHEKYDAPQS